MPSEQLKVGVIGLGSAGRRHVGNLLALGCQVYGSDRSPGACQIAKAQYPALSLEYAQQKLDALVIATPWDTHLDWVEKAIWARIPFFVEKPLGSLEQLPRWRQLTWTELPINQVGYQLRFHGVVAEMLRRVPNPSRGGFHVECDMSSWPGRDYGPPLLEMSHEIDLARSFGADAKVTHVNVEDDWTEFELGERWALRFNSRSNRYMRSWDISGGGYGYMWRFESPDEFGDQMYRDEMAHFLDCVRTQQPTRVSLSEGVIVLEICAQVEELSKELMS